MVMQCDERGAYSGKKGIPQILFFSFAREVQAVYCFYENSVCV